MLKKIVLGLILCVVVLTAGRILLAGEVAKSVQTDASLVSKGQEVGNQICPVTGEKIDTKEKVTYEYKGKIYNLCCSGCIEEFKKDPERYIQVIERNKNNK
jgi:YHS domain-containing protein